MRPWKSVIVVALLTLAVVGLVGTANAQYFGQNKVQYRQYDWRSITSDHFEVYFYDGEDSLAMRVLDLAEKTSVMLSRRMGHSLGRRIPILLYGSHNDFSQTNVTPELIEANTGGFTEVLRDRVVLPFTGSYEDLRHVVVHELTHAFMFDLLYGGSATALIARQSFFSAPLWFAEGLAEYMSLGMEPNAEMFLRDGSVTGYLPPLEYANGYFVYKMGQSAISFLVDRYGEDRLRDLLQRTRQMRSFDRAFERSLDMPVSKFDEQWRTWLRKTYWPTVAVKEDPERFARQLTDHRHDQSNLNTAPAVSPQGDRIAYFSDRHQYTDVHVMSAFDGKVLRRVIRGEQSRQFESIPSFRSSLTWSPDGERLALTAKSDGHDVLYVVTVNDGKIRRRFQLPCEALYYPAWSPTSDSIAVVGVRQGRSDLWMVNARTGQVTRLTDDTWDEKEPAWSPDGQRLTFSSDRWTPVVLQPARTASGFGHYALFDLDLASGQITRLLDTGGEDHSPAWSPDGQKLAFISDRGGTPNILLYTRADSTFTQLTDVLGGVTSLSWSRQNDRLVFSAFNRGGFDVFAVREPLSSEATLARLRREFPQSVLTPEVAQTSEGDSIRLPPPRAALAAAWPESLTISPDSLLASGIHPRRGEIPVRSDTVRVEPPHRYPWSSSAPPAWDRGEERIAARPDSSRPLPTLTPLEERGGPFALPDSLLAQKPAPYHVHLSADFAGAGLYAAPGIGFAGSTQFQFSDFLGNHSLYVVTDVFSGSLSDASALAIYSYLPRRLDWSGGLFHFKNYYSSRVTTLGEQLGSPRLFSERTFGALLSASYPFDRFRRVDFGYTEMFVERVFFEEDPISGLFDQVGREYRSVSSPSVSLVGDNALYGYYGPVNGHRYNLSFSPSFAWTSNGLSYQTTTYDSRRYWDLTHGYTFAGRVLGGRSDGRDAQTFRVGGFSTLRGFSDFDLLGSRVAIVNAELRFPFIQTLGVVGPVPVGAFNLRGALFADAGAVWNRGDELKLTHEVDGSRRLDDVKLGYGVGVRTSVFFVILKLDTAWSTDLHGSSQPRWHFSIGPEF